MPPDIFLLAGQSNASGNGDPLDPALDTAPIPGVLQWDAETQAILPATTPLRHHTAPPRVGFGYHFAAGYHRVTNRDIILIPRGKDESRLIQGFWQWGEPGGEGYEDAIAQANIAIVQTGGALRGILWHQGEADTLRTPTEHDYRAALAALIAGWRARIIGAETTPVLCAAFSPDWSAATPAAHPIEAALRSIATWCPHTACVATEGLKGNEWQGDEIHFSAAAQRELAIRYLAAYQALIGNI